MVPKNFAEQEKYNTGIAITDLFTNQTSGIVTARDAIVIDINKQKLKNRILKICDRNFSDQQIRNYLFPGKKDGKYLAGDTRGWKLEHARLKIQNNNHDKFVTNISYRPFDNRYIYYSSDMVDWGREGTMHHFLAGENVGLAMCKQFKSGDTYQHVFITNEITESSLVSNRTSEITSVFPLYLYPESTDGQLDELDSTKGRTPNLNTEIVDAIARRLGLTFTAEKERAADRFAPIDILDYIYAVLHSPSYRQQYREFLKIDFPRVPYPTDAAMFWRLVEHGGALRTIHLLEHPVVQQFRTTFPSNGDNIVGKIRYTEGNAYINDSQHFGNVPQTAWDFYIGGYQPAQKWLKDRKGRALTFDDIEHYQKIIRALTETERIMGEIDD